MRTTEESREALQFGYELLTEEEWGALFDEDEARIADLTAERDSLSETLKRYETLVRVMERDMLTYGARWSYEAIDAKRDTMVTLEGQVKHG